WRRRNGLRLNAPATRSSAWTPRSATTPPLCFSSSKAWALSSARSSGWNRCFAASATDARRRLAADWRPVPWRSGGVERDQGVSKSGNRRLRKTMIELAGFWLRRQPDSALSRWFQARVGAAKGRIRRIAIVALARKLLVALRRYVAQGVVPEGAVFKAA